MNIIIIDIQHCRLTNETEKGNLPAVNSND